MKKKLNLIAFFIFLNGFLLTQSLPVSAELIEPSRTLEGRQKPMGRLSVFSEPPKLDVFLDSLQIGKTPVISKEVTAGVHILRVKDIEREITILSGKSLQMRLFKGSFIEIPEKKPEVSAPPKSEKKVDETKKTEDHQKDRKEYDPFYWPLNPSGPIQ